MEINKGCVYFFRHVGLSPVKIGYSTNESPIQRFNQFKTYAPYGSEILGFVILSNPKEVETFLHKKYANKRLNGEWFDLTDDDVQKEIKFYTDVSIIEERNEFQIAWANFIDRKKTKVKKLFGKIQKENERKKYFFKIYEENPELNRTQIALELGVSRKSIQTWIKEINSLKT